MTNIVTWCLENIDLSSLKSNKPYLFTTVLPPLTENVGDKHDTNIRSKQMLPFDFAGQNWRLLHASKDVKYRTFVGTTSK